MKERIEELRNQARWLNFKAAVYRWLAFSLVVVVINLVAILIGRWL